MNEIELGNDELYPKFDLTDKDGYELRDARFFQYASRTVSTVNRFANLNRKYQHFGNEEDS